jgi:hypothetical protein
MRVSFIMGRNHWQPNGFVSHKEFQMSFPSPEHAADHPDYSAACREALDAPLRKLAAEAVEAGWDEKEVANAIEELGRLRALAPSSHSNGADQHHLPVVSDFPID